MPLSCKELETLVDPYLDDELDDRDLRDFLEHTGDCTECGERLKAEESDRRLLRARLAAPPAPFAFHERMRASLDEADHAARLAARRARLGWILPGTAVVAAAAALALFVMTKQPQPIHSSVTTAAVRQHSRQLPVDVKGAQVQKFVHDHYSPRAQLPQFRTNADLVGARATSLMGEAAMQLFFKVEKNRRRHDVQVHMFRANRFRVPSKRYKLVAGHRVWIDDIGGISTITVKLADGNGYVFTSPSMQPEDLLKLLYQSSLISQPDASR